MPPFRLRIVDCGSRIANHRQSPRPSLASTTTTLYFSSMGTLAIAKARSPGRRSDRSSNPWHRRNSRFDPKENAGCRSCNRHPAFVDVQQQRLNCALPSFSLSSEALSRSKVFTACPLDDQLIHPRDLAVDLCLLAK